MWHKLLRIATSKLYFASSFRTDGISIRQGGAFFCVATEPHLKDPGGKSGTAIREYLV